MNRGWGGINLAKRGWRRRRIGDAGDEGER